MKGSAAVIGDFMLPILMPDEIVLKEGKVEQTGGGFYNDPLIPVIPINAKPLYPVRHDWGYQLEGEYGLKMDDTRRGATKALLEKTH